MMADNYAIDTAARFGDIPFVEFTKGLVTGVFDSLVESHISQMEEYSKFVNSLTQDLSTYINNTQDNVSFSEISDFLLSYQLPKIDDTLLSSILDKIQTQDTSAIATPALPNATQPATAETWWGGLINALGPIVHGLVDKINDPTKIAGLHELAAANSQIAATNGAIISAGTQVALSYKNINNAVAALIASNKYGLLQTMSKQGVMRLVVTEGEIETKISFSTWNTSESGSESTHVDNTREVQSYNSLRMRGGGIMGIFRGKRSLETNHSRTRSITVNTAKSYQRDSSGTKVDIFGRVLIKFKTDYAPLNG
jgi:hypothetical protein